MMQIQYSFSVIWLFQHQSTIFTTEQLIFSLCHVVADRELVCRAEGNCTTGDNPLQVQRQVQEMCQQFVVGNTINKRWEKNTTRALSTETLNCIR